MSLAYAQFISPYRLALVLGANHRQRRSIRCSKARAATTPASLSPAGRQSDQPAGRVLLVAPFCGPITESLQALATRPRQDDGRIPRRLQHRDRGDLHRRCSTHARGVKQMLPNRVQEADPSRPRYLDDSALETPSLALADAARETLHMGDIVEVMLRKVMAAIMPTIAPWSTRSSKMTQPSTASMRPSSSM